MPALAPSRASFTPTGVRLWEQGLPAIAFNTETSGLKPSLNHHAIPGYFCLPNRGGNGMPTPAQSNRLRIGRYSEQNRIYLVTLVTLDRQPLLQDWSTTRPIINAFKQAQLEGEAISLCWVVMPDHFHWLIDLQTQDLPRVMARMKSRSTVNFNRNLERTGPLWQKGFHDRALRKDENIRKVARYIVANPLRAGLVNSIGDYPMWDAIWI
jgi:REP element-mobilizing transposase RayT